MLKPLAEEWLDHELSVRSAAEIDALFEGVISLLAQLRSDDSPTLLIRRGIDVLDEGMGLVARVHNFGTEDVRAEEIGLPADIGDPLRAPGVAFGAEPVGQVDPGA
jgi:hypothetical protein